MKDITTFVEAFSVKENVWLGRRQWQKWQKEEQE